MREENLHSLWKIFDALEWSALVLAKNQQFLGMNQVAKTMFGQGGALSFSDFKKIFKRDDAWAMSHCLTESLGGKTIERDFLVHHLSTQYLKIVFVPFGSFEGEETILLLAREGKAPLEDDFLRPLLEEQVETLLGHLLLKVDYPQDLISLFSEGKKAGTKAQPILLERYLEALKKIMEAPLGQKNVQLKTCSTKLLPELTFSPLYFNHLFFTSVVFFLELIHKANFKTEGLVKVEINQGREGVELLVSASPIQEEIKASKKAALMEAGHPSELSGGDARLWVASRLLSLHGSSLKLDKRKDLIKLMVYIKSL